MSNSIHVFIDESGDLGKHGAKHFIIAALITETPKLISKIAKRVRQRKLKKRLKELPEIKANNCNDEIRKFVLTNVSRKNCRIIALVVVKERVFSNLMQVQNKLYNYLCKILLDKLDDKNKNIEIVIDKKYTNRLLREDFDNYIRRELAKERSIKINVHQLPSHSSNELQVVDFVAWAINRKYNVKDDKYYKIIEEKITNRNNMLWP